MRHSFVLLLLFIASFGSKSQEVVKWQDLMDITFKDIYLESEDMYIYFPIFTEKQRQYEGKQIEITGYIIPIDVSLNQYVLSAYPFSACFFCGNAGPESVMAVYFKNDNRSFKTDERLTLKGILKLNDTDVDELVYVLDDVDVK